MAYNFVDFHEKILDVALLHLRFLHSISSFRLKISISSQRIPYEDTPYGYFFEKFGLQHFELQHVQHQRHEGKL